MYDMGVKEVHCIYAILNAQQPGIEAAYSFLNDSDP
jgi:hypothetical protein